MRALAPRHAPILGRPISFVGGGGHWVQWEGDRPVGGVLLLGSNFAPTHKLWCAFGMPPAEYSTRRGPRKWMRGVYVNATAVACEVPAGYLGDYPVSASTDDVRYSTVTSNITY